MDEHVGNHVLTAVEDVGIIVEYIFLHHHSEQTQGWIRLVCQEVLMYMIGLEDFSKSRVE